MTTVFRLQELLNEKGMSQRKLAELSGVSHVTINGMAQNNTKRVDLATLDAIARVLGVRPGDLLTDGQP